MCGIGGIKTDLKDKEVFLKRMMQSLAHRGPDSEGEYFHNSVALGHQRLKIIDLSQSADQPMSNEAKNIWIVYNGEIYNFKDLRRDLESRGHQFRSQSDTEVIIHAYEEWGLDCLDRLRGMFAFCLWDETKRRLFLARDRLGIKPLYYYYKSNTFIFASEVRAILSSGLVSKNLHLQGLEDYLNYGALKEPSTLIEDIHSLLPGHFIILTEKEFKIRKYWDLADCFSSKSFIREEEVTERTNSLLKESLRLHLVSDVPIGIFLSGGIDSSSLVSLTKGLDKRLKTVSVIFHEKQFNEAAYSRAMAKKYNTQHCEALITEEDLFKNLNLCLEAMDQPTFNGVNTYFISKIAKQCNLKVILSGLGGDELFCGYPTFSRIKGLIRFFSLWGHLPKRLRKVSATAIRSCFPDTAAKPKIADLIERGGEENSYFLMRSLFTEFEKKRLLKRPFLSIEDRKAGFGCAKRDIINQVSYLEMKNYMVDILLRDTDFMSMAHSLEVRVPLLDHKLVEFILSVPGKLKIKPHFPKPLLIKGLDEPLPKQIFKRPKAGFVFPFDCWLRQKMRPLVEEELLKKDELLDPILNNREVLKVWKRFLFKKTSWQRPWAIFVLKKWLNTYFK